jgi:hypothetical protein
MLQEALFMIRAVFEKLNRCDVETVSIFGLKYLRIRI